jgi:gamma-glutamyl-gamma-aminobutyrate hydrolase PuuD
MRILISQRDVRIPPSFFQFDALERSWYNLFNKHRLIPVPNTGKIDTTIEFDCLVITGGPDSIERHLTEDALFKHAYDLNKPIIGFCHGAFAINDLTGGTNGIIDNHVHTEHYVLVDGIKQLVNSFHGQSIKTIGNDMQVIAVSDDNSIEAIKHNTKLIYGIVWHPERMDKPVLPNEVKYIIM